MSSIEHLYNWTWSGYNPVSSGWDECVPGHRFGPGLRELYVVHYVLSGKGTFTARGQTHHITRDTIFAFSPYEVVSYEADKDDPWHYVWITFLHNGDVPYIFDSFVSHRSDLRDIFVSIMEYPDHKNSGREFVSGCLWKIAKRMSTSALSDQQMLTMAIKYIDANYRNENLSVANIADNLDIKQSALSAIFVRGKNMSTSEYLIRYRLGKACDCMARQNLSPTLAATTVGYSNYSNFSKIFKKFYGVSPKQFQKNMTETPLQTHSANYDEC